MKHLKSYENIKKSGEKIYDPYFKENMWYIPLPIGPINKPNNDPPEFTEEKTVRIVKKLAKIFNKNNINYRLYYWSDRTNKITQFIYFMLRKKDADKIKKYCEKIENILPKNIRVCNVPSGFRYPDNFEQGIISINEIESVFVAYKYNL